MFVCHHFHRCSEGKSQVTLLSQFLLFWFDFRRFDIWILELTWIWWLDLVLTGTPTSTPPMARDRGTDEDSYLNQIWIWRDQTVIFSIQVLMDPGLVGIWIESPLWDPVDRPRTADISWDSISGYPYWAVPLQACSTLNYALLTVSYLTIWIHSVFSRP